MRLRGEGVYADGVIARQAPPFPGVAAALDADLSGWGFTTLVGWQLLPALEIDAGVNALRLAPGEGADERRVYEYIGAVQGFIGPKFKAGLAVNMRTIEAPDAGPDVVRILDSAGPRLSAFSQIQF
ncbi:MAG: hypothetical protein KC620_02950 [Myxococcales bacterium]|nr:hypothetical protein [Myxococcales bacterium]